MYVYMYIYVCMCVCMYTGICTCIPVKKAIAEVQNWRLYSMKRGINPQKCSIHIISEIFLLVVLCLQSEEYVGLEMRGWE